MIRGGAGGPGRGGGAGHPGTVAFDQGQGGRWVGQPTDSSGAADLLGVCVAQVAEDVGDPVDRGVEGHAIEGVDRAEQLSVAVLGRADNDTAGSRGFGGAPRGAVGIELDQRLVDLGVEAGRPDTRGEPGDAAVDQPRHVQLQVPGAAQDHPHLEPVDRTGRELVEQSRHPVPEVQPVTDQPPRAPAGAVRGEARSVIANSPIVGVPSPPGAMVPSAPIGFGPMSGCGGCRSA